MAGARDGGAARLPGAASDGARAAPRPAGRRGARGRAADGPGDRGQGAPTGASFPLPRFLQARAAVGACAALVVLLQGGGGQGAPHGGAALALLVWIGAGSLLPLLRAAARSPREALGVLLALDTAAAAAVIWSAGGHTQPALLLLTLPIFAGALVLQWRAGLILGMEAALLYEGMALSAGSVPQGFSGLWSGIAYHAGVFVAIGLAAGFLGQRVAAQRRETEVARRELTAVQLGTDRIVECLGCGLIALDAAGEVRTVNRAARRMLGLNGEARELGEWLGPRNAPLARRLREAQRHGSAESEVEVQLRGLRRGFPALVRTAPLVGTAGERHGLVALFWDLTERRAGEEAARQRERLAAVGELAAGLAHEIRNSLKPITGCVELIEKRGGVPEAQRPMMEVITREAASLEAFLSQFLALARDKTLKLEELELEELIGGEARALMLAEGRHAGRVVVADTSGVRLIGDREWLRQVFRNLILNGLEATTQGQVRVECLRFRRRGQAWVRVRVQDEGPGFRRLDFGEALKPFRSGKASGTGLGLPTALRGVREHGGRIVLGRESGPGATLWVELPLAGPGQSRQAGRAA
ncbi:MAG: PAS domain-containing protein [Candidatus Eisenbacteria bacterium]|uniref:histidine kinase n=1 Tax=Eiseniibacteriota bacterium TaxID=2212470 RepID=A0A937XA69_UNCEI|nr:PAS domain-containing protein [Candidatus Eisenbacteria bacterium]